MGITNVTLDILSTLLERVKDVTDFDWSENDKDAVAYMDDLRDYADSVRELIS